MKIGDITKLLGKVRLIAWVAVLATMLLGIELWVLTVGILQQLDLNTQLTIFGITLTIVMALGYRVVGPTGIFVKNGRR